MSVCLSLEPRFDITFNALFFTCQVFIIKNFIFQKRWEFLRKAIRKLLVYDIPAGSMVGVVKFDQTAYAKLPLEELPATLNDRQRLATASMPRNPSKVTQSQKCIICGLEEAARVRF